MSSLAGAGGIPLNRIFPLMTPSSAFDLYSGFFAGSSSGPLFPFVVFLLQDTTIIVAARKTTTLISPHLFIIASLLMNHFTTAFIRGTYRRANRSSAAASLRPGGDT